MVRLLGKGGMGAVYEAKQTRLGRSVALKILPPELHRSPAFASRFQRESRTLALLNHPNIVQVYDSGFAAPHGGSTESDTDETPGRGFFYFIMEYVDGLTLREVIASGAAGTPQTLEIVRQTCDALRFAHELGVVHRDVKPENILLNSSGVVKVADFGLAKLARPDDQGPADGTQPWILTGTHQAMGTPHYMAPEQARGTHDVDHRADLYSLGVVFYELLTGDLPLGRFAPPSAKRDSDARLDDVVMKALECEPARRYQSASDVRTALDDLGLSFAPATDRSSTVGEEAGVASDPRLSPTVLNGPTRAPDRAATDPNVEKADANPESERRVGSRIAVVVGGAAALAFVIALLFLRSPSVAKQAPIESRPRTAVSVPTVLRGHLDRVRAVAFNSDEGQVLTAADDQTIRVWDAESGEERQILRGHGGEVFALAVSPEAGLVVSGSKDETVRVWSLGAPQEAKVLIGHAGAVYGVTIFPDRRWIASVSGDRTVRLWDADSGKTLKVLSGHGDLVSGVARSSDGRRIATASFDGTIRVWDSASGQTLTVFDGHEDDVTAVAFAPDGRRIVSGSRDATVRVWNLSGEVLEHTLRGHSSGVTSVAVTPDGKWILSGSYDGTIKIWDLETGLIRHALKGHTGNVSALALSADGLRLASGSYDRTVRIWDAFEIAE